MTKITEIFEKKKRIPKSDWWLEIAFDRPKFGP